MIDLHVHTSASDGTLSPAELVRQAKASCLTTLAITDHDTVAGVEEALLEGQKIGLEVIPGVEISVEVPKGEMHILGYYVDIKNQQLQRVLEDLQEYRNTRNPRIIKLLNAAGMEITLAEVEVKAAGGIVGRPHIASVLVEKGYVGTVQEAFDLYLAAGKPAYVKKEKLTPQEAIAIIKNSSGIPVLAHPGLLAVKEKNDIHKLVKELSDYGLQGIEVCYPKHTEDAEAAFLAIAKENGLIVTGGSDFHGANKPDIKLGLVRDGRPIPNELAAALKKTAGQR